MNLREEYRRLTDRKQPPAVVRCAACGNLLAKKHADPHHPLGRSGENILNFVWVHRHCHNLTHDNPASAKRVGLLGFDGTLERNHRLGLPGNSHEGLDD